MAARSKSRPSARWAIRTRSNRKIKNEDWNTYRIVAKGFTFQHFINGVATAECTDNDEKERRADGLLALQLHAGPPMKVQFRNIRLKRLGEEKPHAQSKDAKKVVLVAGRPSHGYGSHEHKAGCMLLADALNNSGLAHQSRGRHQWLAEG